MFVQMHKVLHPLRAINPNLRHIKLDKKKAEAFPELLKVFKCHTRSTEIMTQIFKRTDHRRLRLQGMQGRPLKAGAYATIGIHSGKGVPHADAHP